MVTFSVTDAAFAGFRLLRARPKAILLWAGVQTAATIVASTLVVGLSASQQASLQVLQQPDPQNPQAAFAAMWALGPIFLVILAFAVAVSAVLQTAAYRAFLKPAEERWGYLRFGKDELRMAGLMILLGGLLVLFMLVLVFILAMGVAIARLLPDGAQGLIDFLAFVAAFAAIGYVFIRFSLAAPATFMEERLQVMRSWRLTHGHVMQLLAAYVLMAATLAIMLLLVVLIFSALIGAAALFSGADIAQVAAAMGGATPPELPLPVLLLSLVFYIAQLWLIAAATAVQIGPSAESYRELTV